MKKFFLVTGSLMVTTMSATYAQYNIDDNDVKEVKSINMESPNKIQKEGSEENQYAVSEFTRNQFASDFPDATNIRFEKTKFFDEVNYTQKGKKLTAFYDYNSQLVGTIRKRSFRDLPVEAQAKIVDKYPNYTVVRVLKYKVNIDNDSYIDNNSSEMSLYGNSFENNSNYFVELKNNSNAIVLM